VDRDEPFLYINAMAKSFMKELQPVISVIQRKKKSLGTSRAMELSMPRKGIPYPWISYPVPRTIKSRPRCLISVVFVESVEVVPGTDNYIGHIG